MRSLARWAVTPSKTLQSAYYRWREESGRLPVRERGILTFIRKKNYILSKPKSFFQKSDYQYFCSLRYFLTPNFSPEGIAYISIAYILVNL